MATRAPGAQPGAEADQQPGHGERGSRGLPANRAGTCENGRQDKPKEEREAPALLAEASVQSAVKNSTYPGDLTIQEDEGGRRSTYQRTTRERLP